MGWVRYSYWRCVESISGEGGSGGRSTGNSGRAGSEGGGGGGYQDEEARKKKVARKKCEESWTSGHQRLYGTTKWEPCAASGSHVERRCCLTDEEKRLLVCIHFDLFDLPTLRENGELRHCLKSTWHNLRIGKDYQYENPRIKGGST